MKHRKPTGTKSMIQIGEAAELCGLSRDTLRTYEAKGWVTPARSWNGYRIYTWQQIELLRAIREGKLDPAEGACRS